MGAHRGTAEGGRGWRRALPPPTCNLPSHAMSTAFWNLHSGFNGKLEWTLHGEGWWRARFPLPRPPPSRNLYTHEPRPAGTAVTGSCVEISLEGSRRYG